MGENLKLGTAWTGELDFRCQTEGICSGCGIEPLLFVKLSWCIHCGQRGTVRTVFVRLTKPHWYAT